MDTHQYFPKQVEKGLLRFRTEIRSVENASDNNVGSGGPGALGWAGIRPVRLCNPTKCCPVCWL